VHRCKALGERPQLVRELVLPGRRLLRGSPECTDCFFQRSGQGLLRCILLALSCAATSAWQHGTTAMWLALRRTGEGECVVGRRIAGVQRSDEVEALGDR
jgi:hypothetical protein